MERIVERVSSHELYHWGIKGMKWGRRRYQNSDGSLTPAGQKRYDKAMDKIQTKERELSNKRAYIERKNTIKEAKKNYKNEEKEYKDYKNKQSIEKKVEKKAEKEAKKEQKRMEASKNKPISEMTNEELLAYKQRLQAEKDIYNLKSEISRLNPPPESSGKKMVDFVKDFTVNELWGDVTKPAVKKFLDKKIGEEGNSEIDKIKKEADLWKQKENLSSSKYTIWSNKYKQEHEIYESKGAGKGKGNSSTPNNSTPNSNADRDNNSDYQNASNSKNNKQNQKQNGGEANKGNQGNQTGPSMSKAEKKAWKKVNDYNKNWWERDAVRPVNDQYTKRLTSEDVERYKARAKDVIGKGTSKYEEQDISPIIDGDYRAVVTNYPAVINRGERAANNVLAMLEDKRLKHSDDDFEYLIQNGLENSIDQSLDELYHYGILGMKWGKRRFQNKDGTRTAAGKKRENDAKRFGRKKISKKNLDTMKKDASQYGDLMAKNADREANNAYHKAEEALRYNTDYKNKNLSGYSPGSIRKPYSSDEIYEFAKKGYDKLIESEYHKKLKDAIDSGRMIVGEDYIYDDMVMEFTKTGVDKSKKLYDSAKRSRNRNRFIDLDYYRTATSYDE